MEVRHKGGSEEVARSVRTMAIKLKGIAGQRGTVHWAQHCLMSSRFPGIRQTGLTWD